MSELENINEAALTVRKTFYMILVYAAFCLGMLGLDFNAFNNFEGKIDIPFIENAKVDWATFMILGPLILIALIAYLHVFLGYWLQAPYELRKKSVPTLFSIDNQVAEIMSLLIFYGVPPLILAHFALAGLVQSTSVGEQSQSLARLFPMTAFFLTLLAMVVLLLRRAKNHLPTRKTSLVFVPVVFFAVLALQFSALPFDPFMKYEIKPVSMAIEDQETSEPSIVSVTQEPTTEIHKIIEKSMPEPAVTPLASTDVTIQPPIVMEGVSSEKRKPIRLAYTFYGIASNESWSERHFNNITPGKAIGDVPQPGDSILAIGDVNARAGYIRYTLGSGWVNQKILSVIKKQEVFNVLEVKEVVPGFHWIKVDLSIRDKAAISKLTSN